MQSYLDFIREMSFLRYGGTDEEKRAAQIIRREIAEIGGESEEMPFEVDAPEEQRWSLRVSAPWQEELTALPYGLSGELPERELRFVYLERGDEMDFLGCGDLSDAIVLINTLTMPAYKQLAAHKAAAFLVMDGMYYDDVTTGSLYRKDLRPRYRAKGVIPGFLITAADATRLVRDGAQTLRVSLAQKAVKHPSRNVLAVIPGESEESVVLTAHYDSVLVGTGAWDNATGSAALLGIYRYFLANKPKRTMRFIWCGSEEQGLLGSKAYVTQHPELVEKIKFCFNFDMCGTILGPNKIFITGGEDLMTFAKQFAAEQGYSADFMKIVHSSDSAPFADRGVPSVGLSRGTSTAKIHTRHDLIDILDEGAMVKNVDFAIRMIARVANAAVLPVKTGMPQDMVEAIDKYFLRESDEDKANKVW